MKFLFRRSEPAEPKGLYRPGVSAEEMAQQRREIQAHNLEVIQKVVDQIRRTPLYFSKDTVASGIPLPDLWCNSADSRGQKRDRFELVFLTTEPGIDGRIFADIALIDTQKQIPAAVRIWEFAPQKKPQDYIRITSNMDTTLGYEGNGYATALMSINDEVVQVVIDAILADPALALGRHGKQLPWFAVISDAAATRAEENAVSGRDDVPDSRTNWTSDIVGRVLPDYFKDKAELEKQLGFMPDDVETRYGDYFKIFR